MFTAFSVSVNIFTAFSTTTADDDLNHINCSTIKNSIAFVIPFMTNFDMMRFFSVVDFFIHPKTECFSRPVLWRTKNRKKCSDTHTVATKRHKLDKNIQSLMHNWWNNFCSCFCSEMPQQQSSGWLDMMSMSSSLYTIAVSLTGWVFISADMNMKICYFSERGNRKKISKIA